jgi:hypothetical protein
MGTFASAGPTTLAPGDAGANDPADAQRARMSTRRFSAQQSSVC